MSEERAHDLNVVLPTASSSPACHLLRFVANSIYAIAPERLDELKDACRGLTLCIVDDQSFRCSYKPVESVITLSTGVVEICWAASHAYFTLHTRVLSNRLVDAPRTIDLTTDPMVVSAMKGLAWALDRLTSGGREPWPDGCLRPIPSPVKESSENVADELALCVVAFLIHHELAHHRLRHHAVRSGATADSAWSLEQERDADQEAAEWVLGACKQQEAVFTKRGLGVAVALAILTAYGIHTGDYGGTLHPRSFDRLMHTLDQHIDDDYHVVWAMVVGILSLHLTNVGVATPAVVHESFRSCVDSYMEILANDAEG